MEREPDGLNVGMKWEAFLIALVGGIACAVWDLDLVHRSSNGLQDIIWLVGLFLVQSALVSAVVIWYMGQKLKPLCWGPIPGKRSRRSIEFVNPATIGVILGFFGTLLLSTFLGYRLFP